MLTDKAAPQFRSNVSKANMQIIFLIDSSGSMVQDQQIAYMKGLIQETVHHYKGRRITYAAVALSNGQAQVLSSFTTDTTAITEAVLQLRSGGKTNMKAGFVLINQLLKSKTQLYIFTDGKINAGDTEQPFEEAVSYYKTYLKQVKETTVIDNESGFIRLGLSEKLATAIGAKYNHIDR